MNEDIKSTLRKMDSGTLATIAFGYIDARDKEIAELRKALEHIHEATVEVLEDEAPADPVEAIRLLAKRLNDKSAELCKATSSLETIWGMVEKAKQVRKAETSQAAVDQTPLCANHAQIWYTQRNTLKPECGCVVCEAIQETEALSKQLQLTAGNMKRSQAAWEETAQQAYRNANYYRGLLVRIGSLFGVAARTQDDGGIAHDVLVAKVPELVGKLRADHMVLLDKSRRAYDPAQAGGLAHKIHELEVDNQALRRRVATILRINSRYKGLTGAELPDQLLSALIDHMLWAFETFPEVPVKERMEHCLQEVREVCHNPSDPMEYTDVITITLAAFFKQSFGWGDLVDALKRKLEINKSRRWVGDRHVKESDDDNRS